METSIVCTTKVLPATGMYLTQKTVEKEEDRLFARELYLCASASANDWMEVDEAYKQAYDKRMSELHPAGPGVVIGGGGEAPDDGDGI